MNPWLSIMGSCRGLLLFEYRSGLLVWNPSTRARKEIPYCANADYDAPDCALPFMFGFGYDPSTDDCLIVIASYNLYGDFGRTYFKFFSMKTNSWKRLEGGFSYRNNLDERRAGSVINGAIHWLGFRCGLSQVVTVVFDLTEKNLSEVPLPDTDEISLDNYYLVVLGRFLCLCDAVGSGWIMTEYGVRSSWTKLDQIDIPTSNFLPICYTKCGHTIGGDSGTRLLKFNRNGELLEQREFSDDPCGFEVALYTESLLAPLLGEAGEDGGQ